MGVKTLMFFVRFPVNPDHSNGRYGTEFEMSTRNYVSLNGGSGRNYFDKIDAFFALAEAGNSMQAKYARVELSGLDSSTKEAFDANDQKTYSCINAALINAYQVCGQKAPYSGAHHETLSYGWDIIDQRLAKHGGDRISRSMYKFYWTAYRNSRGTGRPDPTRYVEVELVGYILSLRGKPSDIMELAMRAKLFDILTRNWYCAGGDVDHKQLTKGRLLLHKRPSK